MFRPASVFRKKRVAAAVSGLPVSRICLVHASATVVTGVELFNESPALGVGYSPVLAGNDEGFRASAVVTRSDDG
jgi:hypothetical protein